MSQIDFIDFHMCFGKAQKNGGRVILAYGSVRMSPSITRRGDYRISFGGGGGGNIYTYPSIIQTRGWGLSGWVFVHVEAPASTQSLDQWAPIGIKFSSPCGCLELTLKTTGPLDDSLSFFNSTSGSLYLAAAARNLDGIWPVCIRSWLGFLISDTPLHY